MKKHAIDVNEDDAYYRIPVYVDPVKNSIQDYSIKFPWLYRIRSSLVYLEELDPERRIRDAYLKSRRDEVGTVTFHPYEKPFSSCVLRRFLIEDPYDPDRAVIKHSREKPLSFVIFGKPGLNLDSLGMDLAKYWNSIHISPLVAVKKFDKFKIYENLRGKLCNGSTVGITDLLEFTKEMLKSPEVKRQGYVLTGLPIRQHMDSEFHIINQMDLIFSPDNRPDIVIYVTCPTCDIYKLNMYGFIEDLNTGYGFSMVHVQDGDDLSRTGHQEKQTNLDEKDYNHYLAKENEKYFDLEKNGYWVVFEKLQSCTESLIDDYVDKLLPIIDSYILEYDTQCVFKVDGRIPVTKMLDVIKEKLNTLPFFPLCEAKPLFQEILQKPELEIGIQDDRSEDSIEEEKPEVIPEEEDEDDEDVDEVNETDEEEEDLMADVEKNEPVSEGTAEEDEGELGDKIEPGQELTAFENMEPNEALRRLKGFRIIYENFNWKESDFGVLCPVQFEHGHVCLGVPKYTCSYLGSLYMMSTNEAMEEFIYDPNRFAIPPKPFPTCKIFVTGPPFSGKTSVVNILGKVFNLQTISIKEIIQDISKRTFYEIEREEEVKQQIRMKRVQKVEDETFLSYEKIRGDDIIQWVNEQLPIIYQRLNFTSMIDIETIEKKADDVVEEGDSEELSAEESIREEQEEEVETDELVIPDYEGFLESLYAIPKQNIDEIYATKNYTVDFPSNSELRKIYENPETDPLAMLLKSTNFDTAVIQLANIKKEFKERGLKFFSDLEECNRVFEDPVKLLQHLPGALRMPYYPGKFLDFDDFRVSGKAPPLNGIRTGFGCVNVNLEELVDALEERILQAEAEISLALKTDEVRIGGWIVDDIPLQKPFWDMLIERFLLPDDVIYRNVTQVTRRKIIDSFCNITDPTSLNVEDTELPILESIVKYEESLDSMEDLQTNQLLEARNSFLKVAGHYETALDESDKTSRVKKVCSDSKEKETIEANILDSDDHLEEDAKNMSISMTSYCFTIKEKAVENPFDVDSLGLQQFHVNYWDDYQFLAKCFQKIASSLQSDDSSVELITIYSEKSGKTEQEGNEEASIINERDLNNSLVINEEANLGSNSFESLSTRSSDETEDTIMPVNNSPDSFFSINTRASLMNKRKLKKQQLLALPRKPKTSEPRPSHLGNLFKLHRKIITDPPRQDTHKHNLFEVFHFEMRSHMGQSPGNYELKYLTLIKDLLSKGASIKEISVAMVKYMRFRDKSVESVDNIQFKKPSADMPHLPDIIKPGKTSDLMNVMDIKGVMRTYSKISINKLTSENSSSILLKKDISLSKLSGVSLPPIHKRGASGQEEEDNEGSKIIYHKESDSTQYKSSSVILDFESLLPGSDMSPLKKTIKELHLPKIDNSNQEVNISCHCLGSDVSDTFCHCSISDIDLERKEEKMCVHDESEHGIFPWIPSNVGQKDSEGSDDLQPTRVRKHLALRTVSEFTGELPVIPKYTALPKIRTAPSSITDTEDHIMDEELEEAEDKRNETEYSEVSESEFESTISEESSDDENMVFSEDFTQVPEQYGIFEALINEEGHEETLEETLEEMLEETYEEENMDEDTFQSLSKPIVKSDHKKPRIDDDSVDVLFNLVDEESIMSLNFATSSNELIQYRSLEEGIGPSPELSTEKFDSTDKILLETGDFESQILLPGLTSADWEKFIHLVNCLYLHVTTLKAIGYNDIDPFDSFYLRCCPSGSDLSMTKYRSLVRSSTVHPDLLKKKGMLKTDSKRADSSANTNVQIRASTDDIVSFEEDDLCVLELSLPMTESMFNTAVTTALRCLMRGKTISEVFSSNKHDTVRPCRAKSSLLAAMYQDDSVKVYKPDSLSGIDQISMKMSIDDMSLSDNDLNEKGERVVKSEFIELFKGNALRYRSLDQRFTPSLEMIAAPASYDEHDAEKHEGDSVCPEIFLKTVPRAVLHIPYIVPRFQPVTRSMRVTEYQLRRYYSMQSMCRLVNEEIGQNEGEVEIRYKYILKAPRAKSTKSIYIHTAKRTHIGEEEGKEEEEEEGGKEGGGKEEEEEEEEEEWGEEGGEEGGEEEVGEEEEDKEMEELINKNLQLCRPYDVLKLLFQKYDYISMELPEDDIDSILESELARIDLPMKFKRATQLVNYNIHMWLNEWDTFEQDVLGDIRCNLIKLDFQPAYENLRKHVGGIVGSLVHVYEPAAEVIGIDEEKLIRKIDLKESDLKEGDLEDRPEVLETTVKKVERDMGDTEVKELLPDGYSEFFPYCPVFYKDQNEVIPATNLYAASYKDDIYNFSSKHAMMEFLNKPKYYVPVRSEKPNAVTMPFRICFVVSPDFDGYHMARNVADYFGLALISLEAEIKRIRGDTVDLPVGVFDEDQANLEPFGLDNTVGSNPSENSRWQHFRQYFNLEAPLTGAELDALVQPLWNSGCGFVLYSFPHSYNDLEHMVDSNMVPDAVVFVDASKQRETEKNKFEERIKTRQLLNFGARVRRLLTADATRFRVWKYSYMRLFNIVLRKFLRKRRNERNFRERLKLVLPTFPAKDKRSHEEEEEEEGEEQEKVSASDEDEPLYSDSPVKRASKLMNVLVNPNITSTDRNEFLESFRPTKLEKTVEDLSEEGSSDFSDTPLKRLAKKETELAEIKFPDLNVLREVDCFEWEGELECLTEEDTKGTFNENIVDETEVVSLSDKKPKKSDSKHSSRGKKSLSTIEDDVMEDMEEGEEEEEEKQIPEESLEVTSSEKLLKGIEIAVLRSVAQADLFEPTLPKKYLRKFVSEDYLVERPFRRDDYKNNVTDASSTSLLGHLETDTISSREVTSSLSVLEPDFHDRKNRLMQLIYGKHTSIKNYMDKIIKEFKETYPAPTTNARKLQTISLDHSRAKIKEYYKNEKEQIQQMRAFCEGRNIPYIDHNSTSSITILIQKIKNMTRKPNTFEKIYVLNYKTAMKLLNNGYYFLSRFGHWCPVQLYERTESMQCYYPSTVKKKLVIPLVHKRYIYFINGRKSLMKFSQSPSTYIEHDNMLTHFPIKVVIIGSRKARKTSTASRVAKRLGLELVSTEIAIHYVLDKLHWSDLSLTIKKDLQNGDCISRLCIIKCIEAFINGSSKSLTNGWVIEDYPNCVNDLALMKETDLIPNVVFSVELDERFMAQIFSELAEERCSLQEANYVQGEYINMVNDEEEDSYFATEEEIHIEHEIGESTEPEAAAGVRYGGEEEGTVEDDIAPCYLDPSEHPELDYVHRVMENMSHKYSTSSDTMLPWDFDYELIEFEIDRMVPPVRLLEKEILKWLKDIKGYDELLKEIDSIWGNLHKITLRLKSDLDVYMNEVINTYVWSLQDYNNNIFKGVPTSLHLLGVTELEYQLHKSPFNDCCPCCWYYYKTYFRCPTCSFEDMRPGLIQYENYFYWVCLQHRNRFLTIPLKFLMSYDKHFKLGYPEKVSIGESILKDNPNVRYKGFCITCYYNSQPRFVYRKGRGKHSVIVNKNNIYLFCSDKCLSEVLMRPSRYLTMEIEFETDTYPKLARKDEKVPYKMIFEKLVTESVYDAVRNFLFIRPKIYNLSHKTSACTYLGLLLKLKAKYISDDERLYYEEKKDSFELYCKEMDMFCKNLNEINAFMGPLSIIGHAKDRDMPRYVQDKLLGSYLPARFNPT